MARISGVDLPREKRVEIGLTYIFGIGLTLSREILNKTGISPDRQLKCVSVVGASFTARLQFTVDSIAKHTEEPHE